jgi:hypothetical protein
MAGFTFNEATPDAFKHTYEGKTYKFGRNGAITIEGATKALAEDELNKAHEAFSDGFKEFAKTEQLADEQIKLVNKSYQGIVKTGPVKGLEHVGEAFEARLELAQELAFAKRHGMKMEGAMFDELVTHFIKHPNSENLLTAKMHHILNDKEIVDLTKVRKTVTRVDGFHTALEGLHEAGKYDEKAIKELVHTHGTDLVKHLDPEVEASFLKGIKATKANPGVLPLSISNIAQDAMYEARAYKATVGKVVNEIATLQGKTAQGARDFLGRRAKKIENLGKQLEELSKENPKFDRYLHEVIDAHPEKKLINEAKGISGLISKVGKAADAGSEVAEKGAKWLTGGKWYSFKHTAETVGKEADKIGKIRWGKAAIVGVPVAGVLAYVAGIGSKPGKYTEQAMQQQQGQQQGLGVA